MIINIRNIKKNQYVFIKIRSNVIKNSLFKDRHEEGKLNIKK